jgi:hypothetical protein
MSKIRIVSILALAVASAGHARAQSTLSCPAVSTDTTFAGPTVSAECSTTVTQGCTSKSGVTYDTGASLLRLPGSAGNFQSPPGAAVSQNVFYGTSADFDRDGWDDFVAADNTDRIYVMRNQTITCGTAGCTGNSTTAPTAQTIPDSWWDTLTNVRSAAFRLNTTNPSLKAALGSSNLEAPMIAADFNGDGWPDVAVVSASHDAGSNRRWGTAARLFLNTQNCRNASNQPCGIGSLCGAQATNGACSGGTVAGSGTPWLETQLSCTTTTSCTTYFPTFATYDLRTGAAIAVAGSTANNNPQTYKPGDFGPIGHAAQNMGVVDWDGDGDLDILYGHSGGTCPGTLCTTTSQVFYPAIDVWLNDCNTAVGYSAATGSCPNHIPAFSRNMPVCTGTTCDASSNNAHTLIASTAHNTTTIAPSSNLGFDVAVRENMAFAYVDIDQDTDYDLVLGSPGCCSVNANKGNQLRIFRNTSNSPTVHTLDTANPLVLSTSSTTYPGFEGSLTGVFVTDFSDDGWPDIITGSDGAAISGRGGRTRYWKHTGNSSTPYGNSWPSCSGTPATCAGCSASCNPNPTSRLSETCGSNGCKNLTTTPPQFGDFDTGFFIDYDNDPQGTKDMALTNGNDTSEFYLFPNRATPAVVAACGSVVSGTLPTPAKELTVSGACITPNATVPSGTSVTYYLNNESPSNYQYACTQTGTSTFSPALVNGQCCVTFPNNTGRSITWKAELDSNTSDGTGVCSSTGTESPTVSSVAANYTYTQANQHYKAGVVISDGVSYVGSFTQPGNRGHFYALAAGDGTKYYDVATKLDAQSTRNVYTSDLTGTGISRIDFSPSSPSATLQARVGATSSAEATAVINWVLGARFGVNNASFAPTRLGAVQNSTPAVIAAPFRPNWYSFLSLQEKSAYDQYADTYATRVPLVLFASMDGMIHAIISRAATLLSDARSGEEAWAFVPPFVAANMKSDYAATIAAGTLTVTSYPDGSPGLLDYRKANGQIATAAIIAGGEGSSSVTALDVTDTIDPTTLSVAGKGPVPLWSQQPGGAAAGLATSKPGVARTRIGGVETYVVVAGSGIMASDSSKGKIVAGFNLETGALLWQFEAVCPVTSDITIFDTDDEDAYEPGAPQIDGFADRAVFADRCGYVYKLDPGQNLNGGYLGNPGFGPIPLASANGVQRSALFSTALTAGALGANEERPIVGTIGARTDATTDIVLFFGTGGLESQSPSLTNEFYAVYAKNGTIRDKLTSTCSANRCEKFYGGVVVTPETVIIQRSVDPVIGGGSCDFGTSRIQGYTLNSPFAQQYDITQVNGQAMHASSGPLYGDAGALYFATVSGEIKRIGAARAETAGADSAGGTLHGMGASTETGYMNMPFSLLGWRVVL